MQRNSGFKRYYYEYDEIGTIQCLDSNDCYAFFQAAYAHTRIVRSTDGGATWNLIYEHDHLDEEKDSVLEINLCAAVDSNTLYMTYHLAPFLEKSTDGGKTFDRETFGIQIGNNFVADFKMYNDKIGVICSLNELIITKDAWGTYEIIPKGDYKGTGRPIFFINSENVGNLNRVHVASDRFMNFNYEEPRVVRFLL
jgi:hypothetical protein